jgi:hypothetical protein
MGDALATSFDELEGAGFQVEFLSHAYAILTHDFAEAQEQLCAALSTLTIPIEEIIAGGGGEAKGTQRLRRALAELGWEKTEFVVKKIINGKEREAISHLIDHCRTFDSGTVALEIEWNNKDPFYDRDLENFKRLHADGAISLGIIVTRGKTLQTNLPDLVKQFVDERKIENFDGLVEWGYTPTSKQKAAINKRMNRKKNPLSFQEAFVSKFVADKFGKATTHWEKLQVRVDRGVGNPCPLILIGLPDSIVTFDEGKKALEEVLAEEEKIDQEEAKEAGDEPDE